MASLEALKSMEKTIAATHHLDGGAKGYRERLRDLHGEIPFSSNTVGTPPAGFGPVLEWDRDQFEQVTLSAFINAADALGLMIGGVRAQDRVEVTSAAGLASFAQSKRSLAVSLVGLVSGIAGGAVVFNGGSKEAAALIVDAVNKFAEREFDNKGEPKLIRDAFGIEPISHNSAKREGGVVISLPAAGGPYYSGSDDKLNLKSGGPRAE